MHICTYTHIHIYTYTHIHIHTHTRRYIYMHICICIYICIQWIGQKPYSPTHFLWAYLLETEPWWDCGFEQFLGISGIVLVQRAPQRQGRITKQGRLENSDEWGVYLSCGQRCLPSTWKSFNGEFDERHWFLNSGREWIKFRQQVGPSSEKFPQNWPVVRQQKQMIFHWTPEGFQFFGHGIQLIVTMAVWFLQPVLAGRHRSRWMVHSFCYNVIQEETRPIEQLSTNVLAEYYVQFTSHQTTAP